MNKSIDAQIHEVDDTLREDVYSVRAHRGSLSWYEVRLGPRPNRPCYGHCMDGHERHHRDEHSDELCLCAREELLVQTPPLIGGLEGVAIC